MIEAVAREAGASSKVLLVRGWVCVGGTRSMELYVRHRVSMRRSWTGPDGDAGECLFEKDADGDRDATRCVLDDWRHTALDTGSMTCSARLGVNRRPASEWSAMSCMRIADKMEWRATRGPDGLPIWLSERSRKSGVCSTGIWIETE